jgi:putative flippase GtrA
MPPGTGTHSVQTDSYRDSTIDGYIHPMPEELTAAVELPFRHRVRHGIGKPHNWLQLTRFAAVGASGYVVNLIVFAVCVHAIVINYKLAAVAAFAVSVLNNFWWNRHWTFRSQREAHPFEQALKFFAISLVAFGFSYVVLVSLVDGAGFPKVVAQAISIVAATPLSFVGQKLWSFKA